MSVRAIVLGLLTVVLLFGVGAWISVNGNPKQAIVPVATTPAVLTVSVVRAEQRTLDDDIHVVGVTVPREDVVVIPELPGLQIRDIYAEVGDYVKKGQKLALLDAQSLEIQLQALRTEYDRTHDEYENLAAVQSSG